MYKSSKFRDALPKTMVGKILRRALWDEELVKERIEIKKPGFSAVEKPGF